VSRNKWATHGAVIAAELKRRALTYGDMHALGVSTSPQKRVAEWLERHPEWKLDKPKNRRGLVTWRIVRAA
jgi:hypothetical protein